MRIIKKIFIHLSTIYQSLMWGCESRIVRRIIRKENKQSLDTSFADNVLVLAPHSDDEWIGCSELLKGNNCVICALNMIGGDSIEVRKKRLNEISKVTETLGRKFVSIPLFADKVSELKRIIAEERPNFIAIPFYMDWHKDHVEAMNILREASEGYRCDIIMYQVSCPIPKKAITLVLPMTKKEWKYKWSFFKASYPTQAFFPWKRFAQIEKAEGSYVNSYAGNVFSITSIECWRKSFGMLLNLAEVDAFRKELNNIVKLVKLVNNTYDSKIHIVHKGDKQ